MSALTDEQYLEAMTDFTVADDSEVRLRSLKIVKTRKEHDCFCPYCGGMHKIAPGTRAARERAIVDGLWSQSYTCLPCLERWHGICHESDYPDADKPCPCKQSRETTAAKEPTP